MTTKPIQTKPEPYCPECGAKMVLRLPKEYQEWDAFYGCSLFPNCRGSRNIGPDGKPEEDDEPDYREYGYYRAD